MKCPARYLALAAFSLPAIGGCYHYLPLQDATPTAAESPVPEGSRVRVHLAAPRSFDVSGYTAHDIRQIDGSLLGLRGDAWVVAATTMHGLGGNRFDAGAFALDVPVDAIGGAEVRAHSWWRTAVAGSAVAVGIYVLAEMLQGTSSGGTGVPGDGEPRSVIPVP